MPARTRVTLVSCTAAVALLLSGCHSQAPDTQPSSTDAAAATDAAASEHNDQDVTFAQRLILHHQQGVDLAKLVEGRSTIPGVIDLAKNIESAQQAEITTMTGWLTTWGQSATPEQDVPMGEMPGMVDDSVLEQLQTLTGPEFDQLWLPAMISHHRGAVTMAQAEIAHGANAAAKHLAQQIIDTQQAEITTMQGLLDG